MSDEEVEYVEIHEESRAKLVDDMARRVTELSESQRKAEAHRLTEEHARQQAELTERNRNATNESLEKESRELVQGALDEISQRPVEGFKEIFREMFKKKSEVD